MAVPDMFLFTWPQVCGYIDKLHIVISMHLACSYSNIHGCGHVNKPFLPALQEITSRTNFDNLLLYIIWAVQEKSVNPFMEIFCPIYHLH